MAADVDWEAIHRALWRAVQGHTAAMDETAAEYVQAIQEAIRAGGTTLSPQGQQYVTDYLDAAEAQIRGGIAAALAPVAATLAPDLRSAFITERTAAAYAQRWPDGLTLSRRVWEWSRRTEAGVGEVLTAAVRTGQASGNLVMEMQRAIEAAAGERFTIETVRTEDWADRLRAAGRASVRTPGGMTRWVKAVEEARSAVDALQDGGTRRQAEHALASIRKAVADGRQDLVDQHLHWWIYDRQLYALRRIARTEMATAHHQAVIAVGLEDPDVTGFRWRLSASHPVADICDYYANLDLGMGAGVFPRDQVPKGKAHPHCMCSLTPTTRRMRKDGVRGSVDFGDFADRLRPEQRAALVPAWAEQARAAGVPWAELLRADGFGLKMRGEARAAGVVAGMDASGAGAVAAVSPADEVRAALASPAFDAFFADAPGAAPRFAVAALGAAEQQLFGVAGDRLWLSRTSLDEHKARHPEVTIADYRMIPEMVARGDVWGDHLARRYLVLWVGDKPYRAALKADAAGKDAWFLSLVVSGKQKPPKGAVRLR